MLQISGLLLEFQFFPAKSLLIWTIDDVDDKFMAHTEIPILQHYFDFSSYGACISTKDYQVVSQIAMKRSKCIK